MRSHQPDLIEREVVDFDVVAAWMRDTGLPSSGPIEDVELLGGGTQNILVGFSRDGVRYVLRRGPRHLRPRSNDVMRREMQVLAALAGTDVPHPGFVAGCPDESVLGGAVFYLMEPVAGFNASVGLPSLHAADPVMRHEMGLQAAAALARLGAVDHEAVGLGDVGNPDGFLERQVPRWLRDLDSYASFDGYPGHEIPGVAAVAEWLEARCPASFRPGIIHGDYHLSNVMYAPDGPELVAIVDWEMCTVGDPLLDLGWLLATWPNWPAAPAGVSDADVAASASLTAGALGAQGGLPTLTEVIDRYAEGSDRDLSAVAWYAVMACFKLGIVLEGTNARAHAGKAPKATGDLLHAVTLGLFARARSIIASLAGGEPWPSTSP